MGEVSFWKAVGVLFCGLLSWSLTMEGLQFAVFYWQSKKQAKHMKEMQDQMLGGSLPEDFFAANPHLFGFPNAPTVHTTASGIGDHGQYL